MNRWIVDAQPWRNFGGRLREEFSTGPGFQRVLIVVTFLPLIVAIAGQNWKWSFGLPVILFLVVLIGTLSGTHVFATVYLLLDRRQHAGVANAGRNLYAIPAAIMLANMVAATALPLWALLCFMLFYIHYAMYHFGRQNLGVMAFSSMIGRGRPMSAFERRTIQAMVLAGMLGAYSVFAPALMLDQELYPLPVSYVDPVMSKLWYAGAALYAVLTAVVTVHVARHWHEYPRETLLLYLAAVFFYLPVFISNNPAYTLGAFTNAHGLQYLAFLLFHAIGSSRRYGAAHADAVPYGLPPAFWKALAMLPVLGFVATVYAGYYLWNTVASVQSGQLTLLGAVMTHESEIKVLGGLLAGLTMAHYWVDQHLWRFQTKERRAWLSSNYPFVFDKMRQVATPSAPLAVAAE